MLDNHEGPKLDPQNTHRTLSVVVLVYNLSELEGREGQNPGVNSQWGFLAVWPAQLTQ